MTLMMMMILKDILCGTFSPLSLPVHSTGWLLLLSSALHVLHNIYVRVSRLHSNDSEMAVVVSSLCPEGWIQQPQHTCYPYPTITFWAPLPPTTLKNLSPHNLMAVPHLHQSADVLVVLLLAGCGLVARCAGRHRSKTRTRGINYGGGGKDSYRVAFICSRLEEITF